MTVFRELSTDALVTVDSAAISARGAGTLTDEPQFDWILTSDSNGRWQAAVRINALPAGATGARIQVLGNARISIDVGTDLVTQELGDISDCIRADGVVLVGISALNGGGVGHGNWQRIDTNDVDTPSPSAPVLLSPPDLIGVAEVGQILTGTPGDWSYARTLGFVIERRDDEDAAQTDVVAPHTITDGEVGWTYRIAATASNDYDGGSTVVAYSEWSDPVATPVYSKPDTPTAADWSRDFHDYEDGTYTVDLTLDSGLSAVAVQWTNIRASHPDANEDDSFEDTTSLGSDVWRMTSSDDRHLKEYGEGFANLSIRYRTDLAGPWSDRSVDIKPLTYDGPGDPPPDPDPDPVYDWFPLAITTAEQAAAGVYGDGGQHMQGAARCLGSPQYISLSQDVSGLWVSEDGGATYYVPRLQGMGCSAMNSIAIDPVNPLRQLVNAAGFGDDDCKDFQGIYLTTDLWKTCTRVLAKPGDQDWIICRDRYVNRKITFDPSTAGDPEDQRVWYAIIELTSSAVPNGSFVRQNGFLYRSDDGGATWSGKLFTIPAAWGQTGTLLVHPTTGDLYLSTEQGIKRSQDGGSSFNSWGTGYPSGAVKNMVHSSDGATMTIAVEKKGVYRATAGSSVFTLLLSDTNLHTVDVHPADDDIIWALYYKGYPKVSVNGGTYWSNVSSTGAGYARDWYKQIHELPAILGNPDDVEDAVATGGSTFHRMTANMKQNRIAQQGFIGSSNMRTRCSIAFDPEDPESVSMGLNDKTLAWSRGSGLRAWTFNEILPTRPGGSDDVIRSELPGGGSNAVRSGLICFVPPVTGSNRVVLGVGNYSRRILVTADNNGENWKHATASPHPQENFLGGGFSPLDANLCFAGTYRSTNGGVLFSQMTGAQNGVFGVSGQNADVCFAVNISGGKIYRSDSGGDSFTEWVDFGANLGTIYGADPMWVIDPTDDTTSFGVRSDGDLWRATKVGSNPVTFTKCNLLQHMGGGKISGFAVDPNDQDILYAIADRRGVPYIWRSIDRGLTWTDITNGHPLLGRLRWPQVSPFGDVWMGGANGIRLFPPPYASAGSMWLRVRGYSAKKPLPPSVVAPTVDVAPTISGTGLVGGTLTLDPGSFDGTPAPIVTQQWVQNGDPVPAETNLTYSDIISVAPADAVCVVTATNSAGAVEVTTNAIEINSHSVAVADVAGVFGGAATPVLLQDDEIESVKAHATDTLRIRFVGGAQPWVSMMAHVEGVTDTVTLTWDAGSTLYKSSDNSDVYDAFAAQSGGVIGITPYGTPGVAPTIGTLDDKDWPVDTGDRFYNYGQTMTGTPPFDFYLHAKVISVQIFDNGDGSLGCRGLVAGTPAPDVSRQWKLNGAAFDPEQTGALIDAAGLTGDVTCAITAVNEHASDTLESAAITLGAAVNPVILEVIASGTNSGTTSFSATNPAYSIGDLVIVAVHIDRGAQHTLTVTAPDGETVVAAEPYFDTGDTGTGGNSSGLFYYIATSAGAEGANITCTYGTGEQFAVTVAVVDSGTFNAATPLVDVAATSATGLTGEASAVSAAFTATPAAGLVAFFCGSNADAVSGTPSGWTQQVNLDVGAVAGYCATRDAPTTASESVAAGTFTLAGTQIWTGITAVINPGSA